MLLEPGTFLMLIVLGGIVAVDGTSFGQFMISRPLVAASLAGWIVGDPMHGALVGLVLEAFHIGVLPVGAAKYPEGGPAAVAGGAVYATSSLAPSALLLTVLLALLLEWIGGETVRQMRLVNIRLVATERIGTPAKLERRHLSAIALDLLRGMVLVALGTILLGTLIPLLGRYWGLGESIPQIVVSAAVVGMLVSAVRLVGLRPWAAAAGAAAGAFLILFGA
jgi:mannose/fructose/N-acetylgalactosamine-specific phosphotransferase system component IIC